MADSFFGFDTTIPLEDDDGDDGHEDEDKYDAFNDETFGEAINGDWEGMHENLVLLDEVNINKTKVKDKYDYKLNYDHDSDLEINLARVGLEDCDVSQDDIEGRLLLDPSVWSSPAKSLIPQKHNSNDLYGLYGNPDLFLRQNFSQPFNNFPQSRQQQSSSSNQSTHLLGNFSQSQMHNTKQNQQMQQHPLSISSNKIVTVEDIERSIRNKQNSKATSPNGLSQSMINAQVQPSENALMQSKLANHLLNHVPQRQTGPPPWLHQSQHQQRPQVFHNQQIHQQQQQQQQLPPPNRLPPGFSPIHLMGGGPPNINNMGQHHLPSNMQMPLLPPPPNFGSIRPPPGLPMSQQMAPTMSQPHQPNRMPSHIASQHFQQNMQNLQSSVNQFNKRLVQEIQQNHPILAQLNRTFNNSNLNISNNSNNYPYNGNNTPNNNLSQNNNHHQNYNQNRHDGAMSNYDEYSNLMSTRDKQWLLGIQLMQLITETPYIDDFYYTVYKEKYKKQKRNEYESKAHKDNTMNHPLTQPKGGNLNNQQYYIMMNKNGNNQRNGINNRERKISENSNNKNSDNKEIPRTYTPLQFENSLGKLQCGSVTAPRKIIDMDIVGPEIGNTLNSTNEISAQRRSRQLLLHIETLYKIVLKMEDLQNPMAIEAALVMKEKKEKEKQLALEQIAIELLISGNKEPDSTSNSLNSSISSSNDKNEPETFTELLPKLLAGLTSDKVAAMMNVRKGKTLLRRIMPLIRDETQKWDIWCDIFSTLSVIIKKDREDTDGLLKNFNPEFRNQIQYAGMNEIIRISNSILTTNDKKFNYLFESKFCVLSIIQLITRVEQFYIISEDLINTEHKKSWLLFLNLLSNCSSNKFNNNSTNQNKKNSKNNNFKSTNNDILKPVINHFERFKEIKSQDLMNSLSQN